MEFFNTQWSIALLVVFFILLAFMHRYDIINTIISNVIYPVTNHRGQTIQGPKWQSINGQCTEKFLNGRKVSRACSQYGSVYRIWSGCTPEIVLTTPEDLKQFQSDSALHKKAPSSNGGWFFHQILGDCMGLINGDRWQNIRAQFHPHFSHGSVAKSWGFLQDFTGDYFDKLAAETKQSELRPVTSFSTFPFFATAEYLYGPLTKTERGELWLLGQRSLALMGCVLAGGVYRSRLCRWLKPAHYRQLTSFEKDWIHFNRAIVETRKGWSGPLPPVMEAWKAVDEGTITKKEMVQTLSEVLFANLDVSTNVLSWLITFLAEDTAIQQQLRQEITSNAESSEELCKRNDSLLHLCFLESLRLRPFTVFTIPEYSPQTKVLGDFTIPANTSVVVDTLAINHNPHFWGDDSHQFRPWRLKGISTTNLRYNLFTFGFGTRKCLGKHFAEAMMKKFVCELLSRYEIRVPKKGNHDLGSQKIQATWVPLSNIGIALIPVKNGRI